MAPAKGRFRGIRYTTTWDASDAIASRGVPHVLARPDFRAGIGCLSKLDLVFDAWVFHHQLGKLADLARAFPEVTIVVCHCGGLLGYGPYAADKEGAFQHWRKGRPGPLPERSI
jgi:predicted TIM-barrel fold metal-dependent hydrolase